jgi:hypothetical protein
MHRLVGGGRLVWITEDKVDAETPLRCAVCDAALGGG